MFTYSLKSSILLKTVAIVIVCIFSANSVSFAGSNTLSPEVSNPDVYASMRHMMEERIKPPTQHPRQSTSGAESTGMASYLTREEIKDAVLKLSHASEKILKAEVSLGIDKPLEEIGSLKIDRLNIVKLENGFVVIPVKLKDRWHYFMYRNLGFPLIQRDFDTAVAKEDNWLEGGNNLQGIMFGGVEAFLVTRAGAESIIWTSNFDREYNGIWTDWDGTVTPLKKDETDVVKPNRGVLKRLIHQWKNGVKLSFGTRRRRAGAEDIRRELLAAGASPEDLNGVYAYFENGAYGVDLGTGEVFLRKDLSQKSREAALRFLKNKYEDDAKVSEVDASAGESRIRVVLKDNNDLNDYLTRLNADLEEISGDIDQRLIARIDSGSSVPRISIMRADVDKTGGLFDFSSRTGIGIARIAKFGDQAHSGQYEMAEGLDRRQLEGNDWSVLRFEGSFSVGKADASSICPIQSRNKNDKGILELLDRLRFAPSSDPEERLDVIFQKAVTAFHNTVDAIKQRFLRGGSYNNEIEKIKRWIAVSFWVNQADGATTLVACHGPAGSGKTTTANDVLRDLSKYFGIRGRKLGIDEWMNQQGRRGEGEKVKYQTDRFIQNLKDLKASRRIVKPMFDSDTSGNLLFARTVEGKVILHNGRRALLIDISNEKIEEWETDLKTGELTKYLRAPEIGQETRIWSGRCGSTDVEIEFYKNGGPVSITVAGNKHMVERRERELILAGPADEQGVNLKAGFENAIEVQDVVEPGGLIIIEGTRVLNDKKVGGLAQNEVFAVKGLFDETIEFKAPFEVRRVRALRRTEARDMPLKAVDREAQEYKKKQEESEPASLSAGGRARVHIDLQTLPEAVWDKYKSGLLLSPPVANELRRIGVDPKKLQERLDDITRERIVQVVLDEVAKDGGLSYPDRTKDMEDRRRRFNNPDSPYITLQAGFLEIKVSKSTLKSGTASLDEGLIERYEKIKMRSRFLMDPGEIVDLTSAGRIPVDLGGSEGVIPMRFGKVLVQNHIQWLDGYLRELAEKGKIDEAKKVVDRFFDTQREMWERGTIDREPDITWRYGRIFIEDEERVVTTSPSSIDMGQAAIENFDPKQYLNQATKDRLGDISKELLVYYMGQVELRILQPLGYKGLSDFERDAVRASSSGEDLKNAKEVLYANFFEKALPEQDKTGNIIVDRASATRHSRVVGADTVRSVRNIGVSHPYIDAAQLDYVYELTLMSMLKRLKEEFLPMAEIDVTDLQWAQFVFTAQSEDPYNDFYILLKIFYDLLKKNPDLLDEVRDPNLLDDLVYSIFEQPYLEKNMEAPLIGECTWSVFNFFIEEARNMGKKKLEVSDPDRIKMLRREGAKAQVCKAIDNGEETVIRIRQGASPRPMAVITDWTGVVKQHASTVNYKLYNQILGLNQENEEGKRLGKLEDLAGLSIIERLEKVRQIAIARGLSPKDTAGLVSDLEKLSVSEIERLKHERGESDWLMPGARKFFANVKGLLKAGNKTLFLLSAKPKGMVAAEANASGFSEFNPDTLYSLRPSVDDKGYPTRMVPIMEVARSPEVNKIANRLVVIDDTPRGIKEAAVTGALTVGFVGEGTKEERKMRAGKLIEAGADVLITSFEGIPSWTLLNSIGFRSIEQYIKDGPIYLRRLVGPHGLPTDYGKVWGLPAAQVEEMIGIDLPIAGDKDVKLLGNLTFACGLPNNRYTSLAQTPYGDMPLDHLISQHAQAVLGVDSEDLYPFFMKYLFIKGEPVIWVGIKGGYDIEEVIQGLEGLSVIREEKKRLYFEALQKDENDKADAILEEYLQAVNKFCDKYFNRIDVDRKATSVYIPAGVIHAAGTGLSIQLHDPENRPKDELWMTGPEYAGSHGFMVIEPQQVSNLTYQIVLRDLTREFDEKGFKRGLEILRNADQQFPRGEELIKYLSGYPKDRAKFAFDIVTLKPGEDRFIPGSEDTPQTIFVHKGALTVKDPRDGAERTLVSPSALIMPCHSTGVRLLNKSNAPATSFIIYLPAKASQELKETARSSTSGISAGKQEAVFFDMDGVLYRRPTDKFTTLARTLRDRFNVVISEDELRKIEYINTEWRERVMEGRMTEEEFITATNSLLKQRGLKKDLSIDEFYSIYFGDRLPNKKLYSYLLELKARGVAVGIISDRLIGDSRLMRERLASDFPGIFDEDLIFFSSEKHATKHSGLFDIAIGVTKAKGMAQEDIIMVDDNPKVLLNAKKSGLGAVNYVWHDQPEAPEPAHVFKNSRFELAAMDMQSKNPGLYHISDRVVGALKESIESKKPKYVVWTSELERRGLPFTADIHSRRDAVEATKETDPIRDILVITDSRIVGERDAATRNAMIQNYLEKKGLAEVIAPAQVICLDGNRDISINEIYGHLRGVYGDIDKKDICIGSVQGEFKYDDFGREFKVVELAQDAVSNIGMYKLMTEMLFVEDISGSFLRSDAARKGWYMYLPPSVPANYQTIYEEYRRYMDSVLAKA